MPEPRSAPRPAVAVFDVDGTLTTGDCVLPFLRRVAGRRLAGALLRHPWALLGGLARRDRDRLKALVCASLAGLPAGDVDRSGAEFAHEVASSRLREDTAARLRQHRELGHTVVLASASLDPYLLPLGTLLGADDVVCTMLERGADGLLTGRLHGANCRGPEKARRVRALLERRGLEAAELWAYGDSPDDEPLLASADHGIRVGGAPLSLLDTGG
ncbi:MAG TPA: HAD-IB family hydrolase [Gaiella sp.]|nr:HAD-IB family hydrolase [Gaiella sp.]